MITYDLAPFNGRNNFYLLLNSLGLNGVGVEVGTHRGDYAKVLADTWKCKQLYTVDAYYTGYDSRDPISKQQDRGGDRAQALKQLGEYPHVQMLVQNSESAARWLSRLPPVDFVYLDGDHTYESIYKDLRSWWPLVTSGGVLAGHDIICPGAIEEESYNYGIQLALNTFFGTSLGVKVYLVPEQECRPLSFYIIKPK